MARRKLSKNQSRRVGKRQSERIARANDVSKSPSDTTDDSLLGPEQRGRVTAHFGTQIEVESEDCKQSQRCHLRANLKQVVTGDWVIWRSGPELGVVESIEDRSSELLRPDSYGNMKTVAANVDQILITIAPEPEPHINLIDRYLVASEINHIRPIILLNKIDLLSKENTAKIIALRSIYEKLGYEICEASADTEHGLDNLMKTLHNKTSIFVGQSGVGKSSIAKKLLPEKEIKIGALSHSAAKGRHTTTHSQLFHFPDGGDVIDSPGIREFGLWHLDAEQVTEGFIEIYEYSQQCKFRICRHKKEPGCGLTAAESSGKIHPERLNSYRRIIQSLDDVTIKNSTHKL